MDKQNLKNRISKNQLADQEKNNNLNSILSGLENNPFDDFESEVRTERQEMINNIKANHDQFLSLTQKNELTKYSLEIIPLSRIIPDPNNARTTFNDEDLASLAESIRSHGLCQPIKVSAFDDHTYQLISGERRYRAAKLAGFKVVPVLISSPHADHSAIALAENLNRIDLHPIEEGRALLRQKELNNNKDWKMIGAEFGLHKSIVSERVRFATEIPHPVQELLIEKRISSRDTLRAMLGIKSTKEAEELIKDEKLTQEKRRKERSTNSNHSIFSCILKQNGDTRTFVDKLKLDKSLTTEELTELKNIFQSKIQEIEQLLPN